MIGLYCVAYAKITQEGKSLQSWIFGSDGNNFFQNFLSTFTLTIYLSGISWCFLQGFQKTIALKNLRACFTMIKNFF